MNFGELSKPGDIFKVADQNTARPGFTLCRHCGKVQTPRRTRAQRHAGTGSLLRVRKAGFE